MATTRQLHRLATRPADYCRYLHTGRLPQGVVPRSPLIDLLLALDPRDLTAIRGLTVGPCLGYSGSRQFASAAQALQWLRPAPEVFDAYPAGSWQDRRFVRRLALSEVLACATSYPDGLAKRYPRLS